MPQQFDLLKTSAVYEIQEDLEDIVSLYRDQAQVAAIAAGAPLVTSLTWPVPAENSIEVLQLDAGAQVWQVSAGAWAVVGWLFTPRYPSLAALQDATGLLDGQMVEVEKAFNGGIEHFRYDAASTLTADGALIVDATGMGGGQFFSTRTMYASYPEAKADLRTFDVGTVLNIQGIRGALIARDTLGSWGQTNAGGQNFDAWSLTNVVTLWGAVGDKVTDDTAAFERCRDAMAAQGGGTAFVPNGVYSLNNFVIQDRNIMFQGTMGGNNYETDATNVILTNVIGADFVLRLKGTSPTAVINAAEGSGLRQVLVKATSKGACDYGLFIDSGATIMEHVTVTDFNYNIVGADQLNANIFNYVLSYRFVHAGLVINEHQANEFMHPNIPDISAVSNTTFEMNGCKIRAGDGFGAVIRSAVGGSLGNTVIESNKQAGLYLYRSDVSTLRGIKFHTLWLENNYEGYIAEADTYSIEGNRALLKSATEYVAWDSLNHAGYQMVVDSETRGGTGGPDSFEFDLCQFNCGEGTDQRAIKMFSGIDFKFNKPWFTGGDTPNLVVLASDVQAAHWYDPIAGNDPTAQVTSLTDNFGANSGTAGVYYKSGTGLTAGENGALYPVFGSTAGPITFKELAAGDPRIADERTLHEYAVRNPTVGLRTDSSAAFTTTFQNNTTVKIGNLVKVEISAVMTATKHAVGDSAIYLPDITDLTNAIGTIAGVCRVQEAGEGGTLLNDGFSHMYFDTENSVHSIKNIFTNISSGQAFQINISLNYTSTN